MFLKKIKQLNRKNKKGFTIIELLVVISITGLLSTISVVSLNGARIKSRDAKRVSDIKQIKTGLDLYFNDNGVYPPNPTSTSLGIGTNLVLCDGGFVASASSCPLGKIYIGKVPRNPTPNGTEYSYSYTTGTEDYALGYSLEKAVESFPAGYNIASSGGNNIASDTIDQGLVAHYPLNGTYLANDISGNNNNGITYGATLTLGINGEANGAYSFDGVDDYININSISSTARTQSGWFYLTATANAKGNSNALFSNLYQLYLNNHLYINGTADFFSAGFTIINSWYHIALVFTDNNNTSSATLYVNGVAKSVIIQPASHDIDNLTSISSSLSGGAFYGSISNIRIYNRALSASEISLLYAQR